MTLLTVKNVSFRYDQKWILKHLDQAIIFVLLVKMEWGKVH